MNPTHPHAETIYPHEAELDDRCRWARMHGLDPLLIPLEEPIEIDYAARRITYKRFVSDHKRPVLPLAGHEPTVLMIRVVHQMESPPRPFPKMETDHG